jgi:flagellar hook assembly protein FlgD
MVISGGPQRLYADESKKFVFAVFVGANEQELDKKMESSRAYAAVNNIGSGFIWNQTPRNTQLKEILIGRDEAIYIDFQVSARTNIEFEVYDMLGKLLKRVSIGEKNAGVYTSERISFDGLSSGTYMVKFITDYGYDALPFVLVR